MKKNNGIYWKPLKLLWIVQIRVIQKSLRVVINDEGKYKRTLWKIIQITILFKTHKACL